MNKHKTFLQQFIEHNNAAKLAGPKKRVLLAVSGGADSVVMAHVFAKAGFPFAIAHCNFGLRGGESDADEEFVIALGQALGVQVFHQKFQTAQYVADKGLPIQLAARQLRYAWFEELRAAHKFNSIATAHHLNDNIETILLHLVKGTGIRGLRGIPVKQGKIIRPLLFATRSQIEDYIAENHLRYREDSSNSSDKYTRNKIRHHLIPLLKEINPALEQTWATQISLFAELEQLYLSNTARLSRQLFLQRGSDFYIPLLKLKKTTNAQTVLYEYLKDYGFTIQQVEDMLAAVDAGPGKQFLSPKARIIKDRRFFILTPSLQQAFTTQFINEGDTEISVSGKVFSISYEAAGSKISGDKNTACIDRQQLQFPLTVRKWKAGDYFYPFGMKMKQKKLKKFFVDEKVPLNEKENILVLESAGRIVWVAGYRLDERFKVKPTSKEILKVKMR